MAEPDNHLLTPAGSSVPVEMEAALLAMLDGEPLSEQEAYYYARGRSANTRHAYRKDLTHFWQWAQNQGVAWLPADPTTVSRYLTELAGNGASVPAMNRRRAAIRYAHEFCNLPNPLKHARVQKVWEGIYNTHSKPAEQADPLMPPELWDVLDACPTTKVWRTPSRKPERDMSGLRDRALLLVGFVAALRRSELAALDVEHLGEHPNGLVLTIPRSKTNQAGEKPELVVLPRGGSRDRSPVQALRDWLDAAAITTGPVFRPVAKSNKPLPRRLTGESVNRIVQQAVARAGLDPDPFSAHSLRAGFVTYAHLRGASDRAIAHQTRHRTLDSLGGYVRIHEAWEDNAATQLGL